MRESIKSGKIESNVVCILIRSCQNLGREISPLYCRIQSGLGCGVVVVAAVVVAVVAPVVGPGKNQ